MSTLTPLVSTMGKQGFPQKTNTRLKIHDPVCSFFYIVYPETLCRISENKKLNNDF